MRRRAGGEEQAGIPKELWWEASSTQALTWARYRREEAGPGMRKVGIQIHFNTPGVPPRGRGLHGEFPGRDDALSPVVAEAAGLEQGSRQM